MMENHSFDNLLGALAALGPAQGARAALQRQRRSAQQQPGGQRHGRVRSFEIPTTAQAPSVTQSWNATHEQINGGKMNGFPNSVDNDEPMGYWTEDVLPFAYSLARTFTLNNRWFCSAPCQTYPNRRFLMAATAYGDIATNTESLEDAPPPNGTIFDRLQTYGVSWRNYFTDLPQTAIIPSVIEKYPTNLAPIAQFYSTAQTGGLPSSASSTPSSARSPTSANRSRTLPALAPIAENARHDRRRRGVRQDMSYGEYWAYNVVDAVLNSPAWPRTLLIYTYDEHGGYYDHVRPPAAIAPDEIPPRLEAGRLPRRL